MAYIWWCTHIKRIPQASKKIYSWGIGSILLQPPCYLAHKRLSPTYRVSVQIIYYACKIYFFWLKYAVQLGPSLQGDLTKELFTAATACD